jgi:hypothetical protein
MRGDPDVEAKVLVSSKTLRLGLGFSILLARLGRNGCLLCFAWCLHRNL